MNCPSCVIVVQHWNHRQWMHLLRGLIIETSLSCTFLHMPLVYVHKIFSLCDLHFQIGSLFFFFSLYTLLMPIWLVIEPSYLIHMCIFLILGTHKNQQSLFCNVWTFFHLSVYGTSNSHLSFI